MWLLFHRKAGTKVVAGGQHITEHCPTCDRTTRLREVEVGESYGVWFIDVVSDAERAFRCDSCGDVFDLRDQPSSATRPSSATSSRSGSSTARSDLAAPTAAERRQAEIDKVEALAAEQRRRDAERAARDVRIDDELAELKKRMGK
jgi:hypothetical protein